MVSGVKENRMKVFQYILTVAEVDEEKVTAIMEAGISTPGVLLRMNSQKLGELVRKDIITDIEFDELMRFRRFMIHYKEDKELPTTLEQWKAEFTPEHYSAFCDKDSAKTASGSYTLKEVNDLMRAVKIEEIMV
ncbi:expressed unknown protein [Seminavis robusta]|uniref:Uncharacterized protein n=1 Tax=Seminavis robusta TaxID=568900 RepID=A0A9N8E7Y4_9STRA|nr:expressed unknown protein [Seminavis robusta]|eukprot:Sro646_g180770.1 n/a (134) ;mRNA; r:34312-34713